MGKEKYRVKVVRGTFAGDCWPDFNSIKECDEYIISTRKEGAGGLVKKGTIEIQKLNGKRYTKVAER